MWRSGTSSRLRASGQQPLDRVAGGLHRGRQHLVGQVVESAREQVHVDRRQLVAGVAQVDRAVERRRVVQPLQPEPAFDRRQRVEDALFEIQQGAGLGGNQVGNGGKRHFELACGARADPPRAGAIGTGSLACTLAGRVGVSTRVLGGAVVGERDLGLSKSRGWGSDARWVRAAASGARPVLIRGGRRVAPTSLRCSARGLPRDSLRALRALRSDTPRQVRHGARCARRPRSCAARRPGNRAGRAPLAARTARCTGMVFPSPLGGEGLGRGAPLLPPGGRPGGCRCLCESAERPAAPKLGRLTSRERVHVRRVHVRLRRGSRTRATPPKKAGTRRCPLKVRLCGQYCSPAS